MNQWIYTRNYEFRFCWQQIMFEIYLNGEFLELKLSTFQQTKKRKNSSIFLSKKKTSALYEWTMVTKSQCWKDFLPICWEGWMENGLSIQSVTEIWFWYLLRKRNAVMPHTHTHIHTPTERVYGDMEMLLVPINR